MPPVEFEPTISAGERLQTYALDRAATGTGILSLLSNQNPLSPPLAPSSAAWNFPQIVQKQFYTNFSSPSKPQADGSKKFIKYF
jgi:hypothetical protein